MAEAFAAPVADPTDRFRDVAVHLGPAAVPLLRGALAAFSCTVISEIHSGTHAVFIGQVTHLIGRDATPLFYQDGAFTSTTPEGNRR